MLTCFKEGLFCCGVTEQDSSEADFSEVELMPSVRLRNLEGGGKDMERHFQVFLVVILSLTTIWKLWRSTVYEGKEL